MEKMKTCSVCGKEKLATSEYFHSDKHVKSGLKAACKECAKEVNKKNHAQYYKNNKEKVNAKNLENYFKKHPKVEKEIIPDGFKRCCVCNELKPKNKEYFGLLKKSKDGFKYSCKECKKQEYINDPDRAKKRAKKYYDENKQHCAKRNKAYKDEHIEEYREYAKIYYAENSDSIKQNVKANFYKRLETDVGFRIFQRCRKRLWEAVKNNSKAARTQELIGCTTEKLLEHLESQFTDGMTFDNYGKWHVDHIKPCRLFDFNSEKEQRECFNYKNLQPLWADDNMRKSGKYETPL